MDLEHEKRLSSVEERAKSNTHRIDKLEESTDAINQLATNMATMVERQAHIGEAVDKLDVKVTAMEQKPAKRWDNIVDKIIWAVVAAVIAFLLGRFGL